MPQGNILSLYATAAILPSVFVKLDPANPFGVVPCALSTDYPIGVSSEAAWQPPIPQLTGAQNAADTTSPSLRVYGVGCRCLLLLGVGGSTLGVPLMSDATGTGTAITATGNNIMGAIPQATQPAGTLVEVLVISPAPLT